ncbi:SGNH/GDSL hydrolase family protein [Sphingomonas sp. OTU376]|uniref:SGNH/GDSL hydrolase family protein n=1 Tax=Sphingomonas sp. OTU376 TaxID=3043863 RepID=UPI00313D28DA
MRYAGFFAAAMLLFALPAAAQGSREVWIDAYQSSPADYDFVIPKEMKLPPETRQRLRDRPPVTGTLRMRFAVAAGGRQVRIRLSNEDGTTPLTVVAASAGIAATGFDAKPGTLRRLSFGGAAQVTIAPGAPVLSDPVALSVPAMGELVVSVHIPAGLKLKGFGNAVMAMGEGDQILAEKIANADTIIGRPPVSGVMVRSASPPRVIVALGDSITDGNRPALDQLHGWPERLNQRIAAAPGRPALAVINAGIGGNRVLSTSWGKAALARFDRDVARVQGVSHVILFEGINDIGNGGSSTMFGNNPPLDVDELIAGYRQIIARAHAANIKVVMATLTPFRGATSYNEAREAQRQAVNRWIRTSGEPDGVIDFDKAVRDPAAPLQLLPAYDSGDHIHPGEAGYRAMGDSIDIALFRKAG